MSCCAFPKDLVQGLEVSLEYELGMILQEDQQFKLEMLI